MKFLWNVQFSTGQATMSWQIWDFIKWFLPLSFTKMQRIPHHYKQSSSSEMRAKMSQQVCFVRDHHLHCCLVRLTQTGLQQHKSVRSLGIADRNSTFLCLFLPSKQMKFFHSPTPSPFAAWPESSHSHWSDCLLSSGTGIVWCTFLKDRMTDTHLWLEEWVVIRTSRLQCLG